MKVLRGKKNFKDVGRVIAFNGETGDEKKQLSSSAFTI